MTDREIWGKYIDLGASCLNKEERLKVMDMLYKYKEAFSLRHERGKCPNIEVDIEVTDRSPFFIRPYHMREEDKEVIDKEMKRLCYMGILKEGFSAYSSPLMLISKKLTNDKKVVTDFRHLNARIAKNNLAYPLVRDTFSVLGNSKCEILSVCRSERCLSLLEIVRKFKKILWNTPILWQLILFVPENANGIKYFTIHMAVIYKCYFGLPPKQKVLQGNYE